MRLRFYAGLTGLGCLMLTGCVAPPAGVTPTEAVAELQTGMPLLRCREACLADWQRVQPQAAQLAAAARWADLAALTLRVGYQDDLSLYYLGQAAEGLGYPAAAASYYRQSTYLSDTSISCRNLSRMCGGLIFPGAAALRLAGIERSLVRPRPRRVAPAGPPRGEPGMVPSEAVAPLPVTAPPPDEPAPPAVPVPGTAVPAPRPPVTAPPGASEYIEPPPAAR
jgi:hypothetical protein